MLIFEQVSKAFTQPDGTVDVLQQADFHLPAGHTAALLGESGCGKSVTMKLMMGLLSPSNGDVLWENSSILDRSEQDLAHDRLRFGYLFQGAALFDSLNVFENVAFGLRQNTKMSDGYIEQVVHERVGGAAAIVTGPDLD